MKKLFKSLVIGSVMASMLLSNVSGVFAKPLDGEVMKQIDYKGGSSKKLNIVVPKEFENIDVYPNTVIVNGYSVLEDEFLNGKTYKWSKTLNEDYARGVLEEYALMEDTGNPYYESDDTKRIDYSERYILSKKGYTYSELNQFYGKDASNLKVYIDGSLRTFKTAFYPKRCLRNHSGNERGRADARLPMVGIREFVDSVDYMSLVWDNGRIIVSNSKTGLDTVFNIYSNSSDLKAVLIDSTAYASLDDLLIAQFSLGTLYGYNTLSISETENLGYYRSGKTLEGTLANVYEAYSNVGTLTSFLTETYIPQGTGISTSSTGDMYAITSWVPYNKEGCLTVLNILENKVNPAGCLYTGNITPIFTIGKTDLNNWKSEMLKVTSKYSSDKEKADALAKYLNSVFFHAGNANTSYSVTDALEDNSFVGVCADVANLYSIGLSDAGIPSVIINGKNKANNARGLSQGHAINGVYYDGSWYYYDVTAYSGLTKDEVSNRFFADAIWGIMVNNSIVSKQEKEIRDELNRRYRGLGYSTFN